MSNAINRPMLIGIGLGPGDPELVTVKAARLLSQSTTIAYFAKEGRIGHARTIAAPYLTSDVKELPLLYPVTTEIHFADKTYNDKMSMFYEHCATSIRTVLQSGESVSLLCEGDPLLYGSFMHMFDRLKDEFDVDVCAGLSGMSGCFAAARQPMTWGDDILTVIPATLDEEILLDHLNRTNAAVIMKLGGNFEKVRHVLTQSKLASRAIYVEHGTMQNQKILPFNDKKDDLAPYFSMVIIPGDGRRP